MVEVGGQDVRAYPQEDGILFIPKKLAYTQPVSISLGVVDPSTQNPRVDGLTEHP